MSKPATGAGDGLRAVADAMSKIADEAHSPSATGAERFARAIADAMSKIADEARAP